ncbi:hypothetical protein B0J13DRAFT_206386 [Dactylonectria estremocensis]|uniref:C2H2-type domain-containing protein n=1 Tax=Dactylonectria estremocensis TaxID=1079267 RepID=A0A9P9DB66_9HYPO|nr:hypothetical protein B0J13DRAFT_206386 [Dactylonectria estremocensis]
MAAGLIGLPPRRADDASIQRVFRSTPFTDTERRACSRFENIPNSKTLPELNQFGGIMNGIYKDVCFQRMQQLIGWYLGIYVAFHNTLTSTINHLSHVKAELRLTTLYAIDKDSGRAECLPQTLGYQGFENVLERLNTIAFITESLRQNVQEECTAGKPGPSCKWSLQELYILLSSDVVTYPLNRTPKAMERKRNSLRKSASCPSCKSTYPTVDQLMAHIRSRCKATRIMSRAPRTKPASIKAVTVSRMHTRNV